MRRYEEPQPISRRDAEEAFKAEDAETICRALIGATYHDGDWLWLQETCLRLLKHPLPDVRGLAATCLGHVARMHRRLELERVKPALAKLAGDAAVAGLVQDALDDVEIYLSLDRRRPP